jgi:hypothetical protein
MVRRPLASTVAVAVLAVGAAACSDDDAAPPTTTASPVTTAATTTAPPVTTAATTAATTTLPPTTTVDVEAIKAQVAADYLKTAQAVEDLLRNPTLDDLDARLAEIAVPGSFMDTGIRQTIEAYVANGQHVVPGSPDYSDSTVESVELVGSPADGRATVRVCVVTNSKLVDSSGLVVGGISSLTAAELEQPMQLTADGWRQSDQTTGLSRHDNTTTCA